MSYLSPSRSRPRAGRSGFRDGRFENVSREGYGRRCESYVGKERVGCQVIRAESRANEKSLVYKVYRGNEM